MSQQQCKELHALGFSECCASKYSAAIKSANPFPEVVVGNGCSQSDHEPE